jgi:hypothetical protein
MKLVWLDLMIMLSREWIRMVVSREWKRMVVVAICCLEKCCLTTCGGTPSRAWPFVQQTFITVATSWRSAS